MSFVIGSVSSTGVRTMVGEAEEVKVDSIFACCSTTGDRDLGGESVVKEEGNVLCDVGVLERPGGGVTANVRGCCGNRFPEGVVGD
jgi:hypothetical protein